MEDEENKKGFLLVCSAVYRDGVLLCHEEKFFGVGTKRRQIDSHLKRLIECSELFKMYPTGEVQVGYERQMKRNKFEYGKLLRFGVHACKDEGGSPFGLDSKAI